MPGKRAEEELDAPQSDQALRGAKPMSQDEARAAIRASEVSELPHRDALQRQFRNSLADIRVHLGADAQAAVRAVGAHAITDGDHIAFATATPSAELVAHEVAHVLQQRGAGPKSEAADEAQAEKIEKGDAAATAEVAQDVKPGGPGVAPALRKKAVSHTEIPEGELEQAAGEHQGGTLTPAKAAAAVAWNDRKWQGAMRAQLLAHLRGGGDDAGAGGFAVADVEKVARIQAGAGVDPGQCDGMIGDTTMAILLHTGLSFAFDSKQKVNPADVQLVFYPGEFEDIDAWKGAAEAAASGHEGDPTFNVYRAMHGHTPPGTGRMYVKWKGSLVEKIDCRGGPPITLKDGKHTADPSKAGTYKLGAGAPVRTDSWYYSQIRWGAKIREAADGEIEFQDPGASSWKVATGAHSVLKDPMNRYDFMDGGTLMTTWTKNDFGAMGYRIENSPGMYIHTTPNDEETVLSGGTPVLEHSHGCLHVNPAERQRLEKEGFLQGGVTLTIKKYDVHLLPKEMRDKMQE